MKKNDNSLTRQDILEIAQSTEGYSGADLKNLCADAAMICLRELSANELINVDAVKVRNITFYCTKKKFEHLILHLSASPNENRRLPQKS